MSAPVGHTHNTSLAVWYGKVFICEWKGKQIRTVSPNLLANSPRKYLARMKCWGCFGATRTSMADAWLKVACGTAVWILGEIPLHSKVSLISKAILWCRYSWLRNVVPQDRSVLIPGFLFYWVFFLSLRLEYLDNGWTLSGKTSLPLCKMLALVLGFCFAGWSLL